MGYSRGKVQAGILSMKFFGRFVVCLRGGAFVGEVAEVVGFVVGAYGRGPFLVGLVPVDAFIFRARPGGPAGVPTVLGEGAQAQVCLAVVQRIFPKNRKNGVAGVLVFVICSNSFARL